MREVRRPAEAEQGGKQGTHRAHYQHKAIISWGNDGLAGLVLVNLTLCSLSLDSCQSLSAPILEAIGSCGGSKGLAYWTRGCDSQAAWCMRAHGRTCCSSSGLGWAVGVAGLESFRCRAQSFSLSWAISAAMTLLLSARSASAVWEEAVRVDQAELVMVIWT